MTKLFEKQRTRGRSSSGLIRFQRSKPSGVSSRTLAIEALESRWLLSGSGLVSYSSDTTMDSLEDTYSFELVGKAVPDEWYNGFGESYVPLGEQEPGDPGQPKVNQLYIWGMTHVDDTVWFGTGANVPSMGHGTSGMGGSETLISVSEGGESQYPLVPDIVRPMLGDWRPPEIFRYDPEGGLIDVTPNDPLLASTLGLRSAGANDEVVFLAGPDIMMLGINLFAFDAQSGAYLGSDHILRYGDIRSWTQVGDQLYTGALKTFSRTGEGVVLRWTGSTRDPFEFTEVGEIDLEAANICEHEGRLYVSTWPLWSGTFMGVLGYRSDATAGIWMSPELGENGLSRWDADDWQQVWSIDQYEPDPVVARSYGGGALYSFDGHLYWGTMQVAGTGAAVFLEAYPDEGLGFMDVFDQTFRPSAFFRGEDFDDPGNTNVEMLFGDETLLKYTPSGSEPGHFDPVPNLHGEPAVFGEAGFGTGTNYYTWSMDVYEDHLYVGTCDFSPSRFADMYIAAGGNVEIVAQMLGGIMLGADLYRFAPDDALGNPVAPQAVTLSGAGNPLNYGFRTMQATEAGLFLGSANCSNLLTEPGPLGVGGWELIRVDVAHSTLTLSASTIAENSPAGALVGILGVAPPDPGEEYLFELTGDAGGRFQIDGNELQVAEGATLDYETAVTHEVTVLATDSQGSSVEQTFSITVTNVNEAPWAITLEGTEVVEQSPTGTLVGTLAAEDPDEGDIPTLVLVDDAGGRFQIVENELQVADGTLLDYTTAPSHTVVVRAVDAGGLAFEREFTIDVREGLSLTGMDVQKGAAQRSFIRYVDLFFASETGLADLVQEGRIQLLRYELDGSGGEIVDLDGVLLANGSQIEFDFGAQGLGGSRSSRAGNGYYEIALDLDRNGTLETTRHFYRLLGDANGDRTVDAGDLDLVSEAMGQTGPNLEADVTGNGRVSFWDWYMTWINSGRGLDGGLPLDD